MKQNKKPDAFHIMKKLRRVLDSCVTPEQKAVAERYKELAFNKYDWSKYTETMQFKFGGGPYPKFFRDLSQIQNTGVRREEKVDYDILVIQKGVGVYEIDTMPRLKETDPPQVHYINHEDDTFESQYV